MFAKVLLIDDDEIVNSINEMILQHANLAKEVITKTNIEEAIEYIKICEKEPEVIFVDVNMPKKDGWDFVEAYETIKKGKIRPKIVMLSSSINPKDEQKAASFDSVLRFVSKPLSPEMANSIYSQFFG